MKVIETSAGVHQLLIGQSSGVFLARDKNTFTDGGTYQISTISRTASVVTVTTTTNHNYLVGFQIVISGVLNNTFNSVTPTSSFTVTAVTPNTFQYAQTGLNASSSGGQADALIYSYPPFITLGSLVLAHPGQLAEVESVTLESQQRGTVPNVSVLAEEISGAFEPLGAPVDDPPVLVPSQTVMSKRYHLATGSQAAFLRHLQVRIDWQVEAVKNELMTFSLFGALQLKE